MVCTSYETNQVLLDAYIVKEAECKYIHVVRTSHPPLPQCFLLLNPIKYLVRTSNAVCTSSYETNQVLLPSTYWQCYRCIHTISTYVPPRSPHNQVGSHDTALVPLHSHLKYAFN
jgi:hypothetical protein